MARYVRFVVHHRIKGAPRRPGLFTAAYALKRRGDLPHHDQERLEQLLEWFQAKLTVPPRGSIPENAIFWYRDAGPFSERMWELVYLMSEYDVIAELVTSSFVGRIVYRDEYQVAAVPRKRGNASDRG